MGAQRLDGGQKFGVSGPFQIAFEGLAANFRAGEGLERAGRCAAESVKIPGCSGSPRTSRRGGVAG
jgi:hypothetical protein